MTDIKPIETNYKGCRFRSRLEARWAVFFDSIGIEWEYEPEGFELPDGTRYLPDFYLPRSKTYAEVKPPKAGCVQEIERAARFVSEEGIKRLLILSNIPNVKRGFPSHPLIYYDNLWMWRNVAFVEFPQAEGWKSDFGITGSIISIDNTYELWMWDINRGEMNYSDADEATEEGKAEMYDRMSIKYANYEDFPYNAETSFTYQAYVAARSARFEFGEEG